MLSPCKQAYMVYTDKGGQLGRRRFGSGVTGKSPVAKTTVSPRGHSIIKVRTFHSPQIPQCCANGTYSLGRIEGKLKRHGKLRMLSVTNMKEKTPKKEIAVVVPSVQAKPSLILEGDPEQQIAFAQKAATALMKVVKPVSIQGKPYLQFGGWQTLARFFGATVGIEWTQKLVDDKGKLVGYEEIGRAHV